MFTGNKFPLSTVPNQNVSRQVLVDLRVTQPKICVAHQKIEYVVNVKRL